MRNKVSVIFVFSLGNKRDEVRCAIIGDHGGFDLSTCLYSFFSPHPINK